MKTWFTITGIGFWQVGNGELKGNLGGHHQLDVAYWALNERWQTPIPKNRVMALVGQVPLG